MNRFLMHRKGLHQQTLPLFIEGVRRSREGVTSAARSVFSALRLERPRPFGAPPL